MHFRHISRNMTPLDCPVDPVVFVPRLLLGETAQGFLTAVYIPRKIHVEEFRRRSYSRMPLKQLLWVH
jgi:hypothetical protein